MSQPSSIVVANSFALLVRDLWERLCAPVGQFSYWTYVFLGIVVFGGLGIWWELGKFIFFDVDGNAGTDGVRLAIITYFPAVGCSAAYQLQLGEKHRSYLRSFGTLASVFFMLCCVLAFLVGLKSPSKSLTMAVVCSVLAVVMFWVANAHDKSLQDADPEAAVGGSTSTKLAGDTTGFRV